MFTFAPKTKKYKQNIGSMKHSSFHTIHSEWLTCFTGDPFADAGGFALEEFSKHYPDQDILEIIRKVTDIYVDTWKAKLNTFFLNSKITQPAFDASRKKEEINKYFLSLIQETLPHKKEGMCRILGKKTKLFPAGRDNSLLSGSGTFVNFHHCFENGIMLSKEIIIRFYFLPLACELLQGRIAIIHANKKSISELFAKDCVKRNLTALATKTSDGVLKSQSRAPGTALFRYVDQIISIIRQEDEIKGLFISLYLFTNFGASPEINIYTLPAEVFMFYCYTQKTQYKQAWNMFVHKYYISADKAQSNKQKDYNNKGQIIEFQETEFQYWRNIIYEKLILGKSILSDILKHSRKHELNWEIIRIYELNIRQMKKETISKIEQMAEFILSSNEEQGIKKVIQKLDGVKNSYLLRRFILKDIVAKYYKEGNSEAIITIEDYADYLFPDTNSWQETRDVLLIAIYQKLHERKIIIDTDLSEQDQIEEDVEL